MELTFSELKRGLLCCTVYHDCANCPLYINDDIGPQQDCVYKLMSAAMNCINVMEKDLVNTNERASDWEAFARNMSKERDA